LILSLVMVLLGAAGPGLEKQALKYLPPWTRRRSVGVATFTREGVENTYAHIDH
jgi:hypothetical protein